MTHVNERKLLGARRHAINLWKLQPRYAICNNKLREGWETFNRQCRLLEGAMMVQHHKSMKKLSMETARQTTSINHGLSRMKAMEAKLVNLTQISFGTLIVSSIHFVEPSYGIPQENYGF